EMNTALRKHFLYSFNELVDEVVQRLRRRPCLPHTQVQRIAQVFFVIGAGVQIHWHQVLRRYSGASGVQLQLAYRNGSAVRSEVSESEDTAAIGNTDEADVVLRPVFQNVLDLTSPAHREVHDPRLAVDVAKLQASFANRRVVYDRQKASRVGH